MPQIILKKTFKVDLNKFIHLHPQVQKDAYNAELDQVFYLVKKYSCELKSNVTEKKFDKYLEKILNTKTLNITDQTEQQNLIESQKSELLFLNYVISKNQVIPQKNSDRQQKKNVTLKKYIDMLKLKDSTAIATNGKVKLSIEAKGGKENILLEFPMLKDNQKFISKLIDETIRFHYENYTSLGWYLRLKKESPTLEQLEKEYQWAIQAGIGRKVVNPDANILLILKVIKTFPQFPDSKRKNTIITESQASFIQRYLHLFGIVDNSYIITTSLTNLEDDTSYNKKLRRRLAKIKH